MSTLNRKLFNRTVPQERGIVGYALGGEVTSQPIPQGNDQGVAAMEGVAQAVDQGEAMLDGAQSIDDVLSAVGGVQTSVTEVRAKVGELIGQEDAAATPDSALMLIQPTLQILQMAEQNMPQGDGIASVPLGDPNNPLAAPAIEAPSGFAPANSFASGGLASGGVGGIMNKGIQANGNYLQDFPTDLDRVSQIQDAYKDSLSGYAPEVRTQEEIEAQRKSVFGETTPAGETDKWLALANFGAGIAGGSNLAEGISKGTRLASPLLSEASKAKRTEDMAIKQSILDTMNQERVQKQNFDASVAKSGADVAWRTATGEQEASAGVYKSGMTIAAQMAVRGEKREGFVIQDPNSVYGVRTVGGIEVNGKWGYQNEDGNYVPLPDTAIKAKEGVRWESSTDKSGLMSGTILYGPRAGETVFKNPAVDALKSRLKGARDEKEQDYFLEVSNRVENQDKNTDEILETIKLEKEAKRNPWEVDVPRGSMDANMFSAEYRTRLAEIYNDADTATKEIEIAIGNMSEILGPGATMRRIATNGISVLLPEGQLADAMTFLGTEKGISQMKFLRRDVVKALVMSSRFPVTEQQIVADLLEATPNFFRNTEAGIVGMQEVLRRLQNQKSQNLGILLDEGYTKLNPSTLGTHDDPYDYTDDKDLKYLEQISADPEMSQNGGLENSVIFFPQAYVLSEEGVAMGLPANAIEGGASGPGVYAKGMTASQLQKGEAPQESQVRIEKRPMSVQEDYQNRYTNDDGYSDSQTDIDTNYNAVYQLLSGSQ